ncbi:MAG TPA: HAMP domain-containing protein [Thermoanaerobaculia bacterium]|nr:HAMP domain-containing protein [Thermoanaerobaculia bacterium]
MTEIATPPTGEAPVPSAAAERQPAASRRRPRLGSLAWQGVVGLLALFSLVFVGIALVMNTYGRQQVAEQSAGKLEETGRRRVEEVRRWLAGESPFAPSHLQRLSQAWQGEASGYAFLLDRDQRFLSFPRPELVGLTSRGGAGKAGATLTAGEVADRHPGFRPIADALRRLPEGGGAAAPVRVPIHVEMPADLLNGEPSLALVFPVPETDWKLVQVSPKGELEQAAGRISRSLLLLISGILAAVLLPSYLFLSRRWITPVTTLAEAATLVRDGELDVRVSMPGRDEIAVLADSFNQMVDQLAANTAGMKQANIELGRSLGLTDTIMGAVREGLFLLTPELAIEAKYSAATRQIFGQEELAGADFLDLIRQITPERTHALTARFLRLLFNPAKTDSVIAKVNPLKEVEASFSSRSGRLEQKFLTFTFERIREGGEIRHAMVTVADVTPRVLLAQQLRQSQQRMERQAELLLSVMHVEPQMLREFIEDAHTELETINALLREGRSAVLSIPDRNTYYRHLVDDIFKNVHTIKGTAAMLRIDYFAAAANRFEEKLAALRDRTVLDGSDFVPIVLELSEMVDSLGEIRDVLARFAETQRSLKATSGASDTEVLSALVTRFVDDLAEKSGKKVVVAFHALGDLAIPFKYKSALRNVMAQLARNSVVHGIETPAERQAAGKPEEGHILVAARQNNGNLELLFKDDGRGIDYKQVIERVQELAKSEPSILEPLIDREQNRWKTDALDQMIFHPGFTTADQATEDAGRGVGMSAVRDALARLDGRISLRQKRGQFCEFRIVLPNGG